MPPTNIDTPAPAPASDAMQVDPPAKEAAEGNSTGGTIAAQAHKPPAPRPTKRVRAVSPRSLEDMKNSLELVFTVFRAVQAHERLFKDAGTLHGDINPNTILIIDWPPDEEAGRPRGRLDGALVDYDVPYSVEGLRHLVHPWPCKYA